MLGYRSSLQAVSLHKENEFCPYVACVLSVCFMISLVNQRPRGRKYPIFPESYPKYKVIVFSQGPKGP